jgi:mannose-1-phosphate guanylyltransferase
MRAMLVTAGFGTRLAPLTDLLPKAAVPVANRPVAAFAIDHLCRAGVRDFVLNTHHLPGELEHALRAAAPSDVQLSFVHEPVILGTGGGVRNAWHPVEGETFVVMNGKVVFAPDIAGALRVHHEAQALATMIVKAVSVGDPLGAVEIDADGRVRRLVGRPDVPAGVALQPTLYTGVSLFDARAHRDLPERGCLIRDAYRHWIERGERVMAFVDGASFRDVGMSLWHYWEANMALLNGSERWPGIEPDAAGVVSADAAQIAPSAQLRQIAVGSGAQIAAGVQVERCVIWPGARVDHDLTNAIVLPSGLTLTVVPPDARSDSAR